MRISDWSSDVCSSDLDGKYVMTKGFVENEPGSSITQVTFGKRLSQLLTAGQEYSWGVRMFTGQSKPGDALDPDDYVAHASTSFKVAPVSLVRSAEHTSELQSLMRISYALFCLNKTKQ